MPSQDGGTIGEELFKGALKMGSLVGRQALSRAVKSDFAKNKIKGIANNYLDQALDSFTSDISKKISPIGKGYDMSMYTDISDPTNPLYDRSQYGQGFDIQKQLSKLGELHMRTPTGKKYNYCGPGTQLDKRLASDDPKIRDPINKLDGICQSHDIAYSKAKTLKDKHEADRHMVKSIDNMKWKDKPWGTTAVRNLINIKQKTGLGLKPKKKPQKKPKNGKSRRVKK